MGKITSKVLCAAFCATAALTALACGGEDGIGTQSFVLVKRRQDPGSLVIYSSDGSVFGEVAPCP